MFQDKEEYAEEDSCGTTVGGLLNTETGGLTSGATAGKYIYLSITIYISKYLYTYIYLSIRQGTQRELRRLLRLQGRVRAGPAESVRLGRLPLPSRQLG